MARAIGATRERFDGALRPRKLPRPRRLMLEIDNETPRRIAVREWNVEIGRAP